MTLTVIRIPERVHQQAVKVLTSYRRRHLFPRRIHKTGYLSLRVNSRWRLLSRDGGKNWEVMSHATYSKRIENK